MLIANPIYDVVFKYLLEDKKVAKLLLSAILEKEIIDLEFKPKEYSTKKEDNTLTVYRVDFKAKIKLNNNETKIVLIELQKAKYYTDLMRFRRYLGRQYANEDNTIKDKDKNIKEVLPIITIYFIAYTLKELEDIPIIYVKREYIDKSTNKLINKKSEFIEALTHDSIVIQIEAIKNKKHKNHLEKILSIFDTVKEHKISINEDDYPKEYKPIIRRLIRAIADEEIEMQMEYEDDILEDIRREARKTKEAQKRAKELEEKVKKAEEKAKQIEEEKLKAEEKAKQIEEEKLKAEQKVKIAEKEKAIEIAKNMLKDNLPLNTIEKYSGLNKEEISELINNKNE